MQEISCHVYLMQIKIYNSEAEDINVAPEKKREKKMVPQDFLWYWNLVLSVND